MVVRVLTGDSRDVLPTLPERSVHVCVTSPPYFGLRSYLPAGHPDKHREIGAERVPDCLGWATGEPCGACFVCHLVEVFRQVRRVLRDDGTLWIVIGDSYAGSWGSQGHRETPASISRNAIRNMPKKASHTGTIRQAGLKPKDLIMVPARLALALQADGWYLRMENVWHKRSCMPESVTDRTTRAHEMVYVFSKAPRYYYDAEAVAEDAVRGAAGSTFTAGKTGVNGLGRVGQAERVESGRRNLRSVWSLSPEPLKGEHYAAFPTEIPKRAILAGTSERGCCPACGAPWARVVERTGEARQKFYSGANEHGSDNRRMMRNGQFHATSETLGWSPACSCDAGDPVPAVCLDPFGGSGTTGLVADRLGRDAVLIDLNPAYAQMGATRITNDAPLFAVVASD